MTHDQWLLGYDAREMWIDGETLWPAERRRMYLLRSDAGKPLSTDTMVWPSVFDEDQSVRRPSWTGAVANLWESLKELQEHLGQGWDAHGKPCWLLAITLVHTLCTEEQKEDWKWRVERVQPSSLGPNHVFLGYDVSDQWLLSGLMNCGYVPEQDKVEGLRQRWATHLNEHHLFEDLEQATAFKAMTDRRVREHAPFFLYGLYRVTNDVGEKTDY